MFVHNNLFTNQTESPGLKININMFQKTKEPGLIGCHYFRIPIPYASTHAQRKKIFEFLCFCFHPKKLISQKNSFSRIISICTPIKAIFTQHSMTIRDDTISVSTPTPNAGAQCNVTLHKSNWLATNTRTVLTL
jgi:hypothetical protein